MPPAEDVLDHRRTAELGMWVFLASEVLMFGGLFMALAVCRWLNPEGWQQASAHLHLWMGTANTAILLTSSLTMALAVGRARAGRGTLWLLAAIALLGLVFLGIKGTEYVLEYDEGLVPGHGFILPGAGTELFFQLYFVATGLHAVHLAIGCGATATMAVMAWKGAASGARVEVLGLYWHFVDVVWVFLFPVFYLAAPR